jgi:hypothetical protein
MKKGGGLTISLRRETRASFRGFKFLGSQLNRGLLGRWRAEVPEFIDLARNSG